MREHEIRTDNGKEGLRRQLDCQISRNFGRQTEDVCRLIRINSVRSEIKPGKPFGEGPAEALREMLGIAEEMGFRIYCVDGCVGVAESDGEQPGIDILAHLDVVPAGSGWTVTEPFCPLITDGRIYGRGAADNKGPAVSVLYALKAARSLGLPFRRKVRILWGTAEETGSEDLPHFYGRYEPAPMTVTPDAAFPVITREKGRFEGHLSAPWQEGAVLKISCEGPANAVPDRARALIRGKDLQQAVHGPSAETGQSGSDLEQAETLWADCGLDWESRLEGTMLTVTGKGAHAASPQKGSNALTALLSVLALLPGTQECLRGLTEVFPHGRFDGNGLGVRKADDGFTASLSSLSWNQENGLQAVFDCRIPVGLTEEETVPEAEKMLSGYGISLDGTWIDPHVVEEDSEFIRTLLRCWEECSGRPGETRSIAGNTYAHGIPGAAAFGFADPEIRTGTHGPDEYVSLAQLELGTRIYARMILELCLS